MSKNEYDLKARVTVDYIFKDLRGRKLLKLLFAEDPDAIGAILHARNGEPLHAINLEGQAEIKAVWTALIASALVIEADARRRAAAKIADEYAAIWSRSTESPDRVTAAVEIAQAIRDSASPWFPPEGVHL